MATWNAESSSSRSRVSDDTVYVAVGIDFEQNKFNISWAIENFPGKDFCILHIHRPAKMIPLEKICVEMDDIGKGIVELIYEHGIKMLVMGAAANKHYTEEMMDLKSTKAKYIQHRAPHPCQIYYVCNGYHIYTWEGDSTGSTEGFRYPAYVMRQRTEANGVELELCEVVQPEVESDNHNAPEGSIDQLYSQLERAVLEVDKYKQEAYEESQRRWEAEKKANTALCRAQGLASLYSKELRRRKETEEALERAKEEDQRTKKQQEEERLVIMDERLMQQIQASDFNTRIEELRNETVAAVEQCKEYAKERDELLEERDTVLRLAQEIAEGLSREENGSLANEHPPSYFVCPISQAVMEDPHVAADGYTYEGEALRGWLSSGHNTSPMINFELQHLNLIPNYTLRSAIIEWKERHRKFFFLHSRMFVVPFSF